MSGLIAKILFTFFAIVGVVELLRRFLLWLMKTDCPETFYLVVPFSGHNDKAEAVLRGALEQIKTLEGEKGLIVCVDCGMDEETKQICRAMCNDNTEIRLCSANELNQIIGRPQN